MISTFKLWPKQGLAFQSPATMKLYGGAAGPGKSHLMRVAFLTWAADVPGLQLYLFRTKYRDLIQGHVEGPTGFKAMLGDAERMGHVKLNELDVYFKNGPTCNFPGPRFEGGSRISLNHCFHEADVFNYKTIEFHVLGIEEATEFTPFKINYLNSRVRMPAVVDVPSRYVMPREYWKDAGTPEMQFPGVLMCSNPGGPGHEYIKKLFRILEPNFDPTKPWRAPKAEGGELRQFIPGLLADNPSVNPVEYEAKLSGLPPEYRRALLEGDWSVSMGQFFSELSREQHLIPDIRVPSHLMKYCWYDWGYSSPACNLWFCVSDGEAMDTLDGRSITLPRGALIVYRELYICDQDDPAKGAKMSNKEQAAQIRALSNAEEIAAYMADGKPFQATGGYLGANPAKEFAEEGINLRLGSLDRKQGWSLVHSRLQSKPYPMLYFCQSAKHTWRCMSSLQSSLLKPEDCDSTGEDHAPDCVRGGCTVRAGVKDRMISTPERLIHELSKKPTMGKILAGQGNGWFK